MLRSLRELLTYRHLVANLVALDLKVRYRRSFLGLLWTLLNPILLMLVMWVVFSRFGRINEKSYAMFLLSGLMTWIFFQQAVSQSLNSVVKNSSLIQKIYVPKLVFPVSTVISNVVNFCFFFIAYHLIAPFTPAGVHLTSFAVVLSLLMAFILATGVSLAMGALNVFFRDFQHLTTVLMRALFYLTPILYRPEMMGEKAKIIFQLNPVSYPVITARMAVYDGELAPLHMWLAGFAVAFTALLVGAIVFVSTEKRFVYYA